MRAFYNKLLLSDHGFLRLKQAIKTLLVLLITLAVLYQQPLMVKVSACLISGFSMQCVVGINKRTQIFSSILAFSSLTLCYALGMLSKHIPWTSICLLTIGAFFSFYIQRIGAGYLFTGLFSWSMIFIGTIFPTNSFLAIEQNILGCLVSSGIAFIIIFLIWPREPQKIFFDNLENYLLICAHCMQRLEKLYHHPTNNGLTNLLNDEAPKLRTSMLLNQAITEQINQYQKNCVNHPLKLIFIQQFSLGKAIGMLLESSDQLHTHLSDIPDLVRKDIAKVFYCFYLAIKKNQLDINKLKVTFPHIEAAEIEEQLNQLKELICHKEVKSEYFIYLVNIHLGLRHLLTSLSAMENAS